MMCPRCKLHCHCEKIHECPECGLFMSFKEETTSNAFPSMRYCIDHNCPNYPDGMFINLGKNLKCPFCKEEFDLNRCKAYVDDHNKLGITITRKWD